MGRRLTTILATSLLFLGLPFSRGDELEDYYEPAKLEMVGYGDVNSFDFPDEDIMGEEFSEDELLLKVFDEACGIRYKDENLGEDYWQSYEETKEKGQGDCEDGAIFLWHKIREEGLGDKEGINPRVEFGIRDEEDKMGHSWVEYTFSTGETVILDPVYMKSYYKDYRPFLSYDVRYTSKLAEKLKKFEEENALQIPLNKRVYNVIEEHNNNNENK